MEQSEVGWEDAVILSHDDVLEVNEDNILPEPQDVIEKIRKWLQPTDYNGKDSEYQKHVNSHLSGTCDWFLTSREYQQWHDSDEHGMLWVRGIHRMPNMIILTNERQQFLARESQYSPLQSFNGYSVSMFRFYTSFSGRLWTPITTPELRCRIG